MSPLPFEVARTPPPEPSTMPFDVRNMLPLVEVRLIEPTLPLTPPLPTATLSGPFTVLAKMPGPPAPVTKPEPVVIVTAPAPVVLAFIPVAPLIAPTPVAIDTLPPTLSTKSAAPCLAVMLPSPK